MGVTAMVTLFCFATTTFADVNMDNENGDAYGQGDSKNAWVLRGKNLRIDDAQGLRVSIYNSETNEQIADSFDISANEKISQIDTEIIHFLNNGKLISKTQWLDKVGSFYTGIDSNSKTKFNNRIEKFLGGDKNYHFEVVEQLNEVTIISTNLNGGAVTDIEEIKKVLSSETFITDMCNYTGDDNINFENFQKGKFKIAYEPVVYFRYDGDNYALTATECGLLDKFLCYTSADGKGLFYLGECVIINSRVFIIHLILVCYMYSGEASTIILF